MIKLKDLLTEVTDAEEKKQGKMCGNCEYFVKDRKQCVLLSPPEVAYKGMCDLWEGGEPTTSDRVELRGMKSQAETHYTDNWKSHKRNQKSSGLQEQEIHGPEVGHWVYLKVLDELIKIIRISGGIVYLKPRDTGGKYSPIPINKLKPAGRSGVKTRIWRKVG